MARNPIDLVSKLVGRLGVGRKLMLIYLLDLTAVIYISGILIHEKFIAIDFARKEIAGAHYIDAVRGPMVHVALPHDAGASRGNAAQVLNAQRDFGDGMRSEEGSTHFIAALGKIEPEPDAATAALATGRDLITRIGNQSNLILDPDLDSYYTMSLLVLRYPELLELVQQSAAKAGVIAKASANPQGGTTGSSSQLHTEFLILEGKLDSVLKGIDSDFDEAFSASSPQLRSALAKTRQDLLAAMAQFRIATRRVHFESRPAAIDAVAPAYAMAVVQLGDTWRLTNSEMVNLLQARVDQQFSRMALHLGTAAALLAVILSLVYFVARQIANPIRHLADVADRVSRTGDYRLRAAPTGADETAHLMHAFNAMLGELDRNRSVREELTAAARAADAQRDLVESFPTPILVTSIPDHRVLHANEPAQKWIDETLCDPWVAGMEPQVRARFFQQLSDLDRADEFEVYWRTGDQQRWALLSARRIEFMGQDALVTVFTPINQLKHLEKRLQLLAKVFEASSESIMITDANQFLVTANAAFNRTMGWDLAEVVGRPLSMFDGDREDDTHFERVRQTCIIRGSWQGELWLKRKNGEVFPNWVVMNAVRGADGQLTHFVSASVDISEHKANEARIQHLAQHDALTGLPNRALCLERLNQAVMHALHEGHHVAVVFIDLDRFKNINDSLGHHVGDALLRSVSQRLGEAVREHDTVSRLGGDEFVVVLTRVADVAEVEHIIEQRLIPLVREPHRIGASELNVSCSVGIALYPQDGKDVDHLMRNADAAMYQAKAGGRNHALFFTHDFQQQAQERLAIENSLPWAVERNELELYYQPRVDAVSGRLLGVEALVRWNHPQQGMVSPAAFIPVAEETGNIHAIGAWTIAQATRQHRQWALDGLGAIPISVNISPLQLRDLSIAELVQGHIDDNAIEPGMLELELTESSLMDNAPATMELLKRFKAMGVSLALDDFGTGYSSLNYLHQFPIDKLKIDQSFIRDMLDDPADLAITKAIIGLGHTLGLVVTAEGVEHLAEAEVLREAGCDELQGFLFARPMPAHELAIWLAMRGATARSVPGQQPQTSSGNGNAHRAPALNG